MKHNERLICPLIYSALLGKHGCAQDVIEQPQARCLKDECAQWVSDEHNDPDGNWVDEGDCASTLIAMAADLVARDRMDRR